MADEERGPLMVTIEQARALASVMRRVLKMNGTGVTNSPDGIIIDIPPAGAGDGGGSEGEDLVVCVRNATGIPGDESTKATWVYDLYDRTNTTLLAEAVELETPRPYGTLLAAADGTYAMATLIDGEYSLLGFLYHETPDTGTATC